MNNNLSKIREEIDLIDNKIQDLLSKRADKALMVANEKKKDKNPVFYVPSTEEEVLDRIIKNNHSILKNESLVKIFEQIIIACRSIQEPVRVSFLGPLYSYSHEAVIKCFGEDLSLHPKVSISEAIIECEQNSSDFCVVPIENSTEGVVGSSLDSLRESSLEVFNEIILPIHHCLISKCKKLTEIKYIYSHPQALQQCREWIERNLPNASLSPTQSTSQAAELASQKDESASIGGEQLLKKESNLKVIAKHIEDCPNNSTRFYVLGKSNRGIISKNTNSKEFKTSMIVYLAHKTGTLFQLLSIFAKRKINLTLIESRPDKQQGWTYYFFLEMQGHSEDANIVSALEKMKEINISFKLLGSFPVWQKI